MLDVTYIRFGRSGAAGSTSWVEGQPMPQEMLAKVKELVAAHDSAPAKPTTKRSGPCSPSIEQFEDMV